MPARSVLVALLLLAVAPPFLARAFGTYVGAFTMLTRVERYHLELSVRTASGEERVKLASLAPHLSRDAKAIILPAEGYAAGADQIDVLLSVYLSAGLNKVNAVWLRGETLELLHRFNTLGGATWTTLHHWLGYGGVAKLTCLTELALPGLLALRATRRGAIIVAAVFHALISASMMVSTFGAQMMVLLLAFWPMDRGTAMPRSPN